MNNVIHIDSKRKSEINFEDFLKEYASSIEANRGVMILVNETGEVRITQSGDFSVAEMIFMGEILKETAMEYVYGE